MISFSSKIAIYITAGKTIFSFSRRPKKMVFPKKLCWNIIFVVLSGKVTFLFPENMILPLRRKMKDDLSQKIHGNMISSWNVLKRWSFQKGLRWDMIFLVLSGKMILFSRKHDIFSLGGKWGAIFFKKYMEIWNFLCTRTGVTNVALWPTVKKIKDDLILQKYTRRWLTF